MIDVLFVWVNRLCLASYLLFKFVLQVTGTRSLTVSDFCSNVRTLTVTYCPMDGPTCPMVQWDRMDSGIWGPQMGQWTVPLVPSNTSSSLHCFSQRRPSTLSFGQYFQSIVDGQLQVLRAAEMEMMNQRSRREASIFQQQDCLSINGH